MSQEGSSSGIKKELDAFFNPKGVAIIGASNNPAKIGYQITNNVIQAGFGGEIFPINPKSEEILGRKAYKSVRNVPFDVDLAVITIPAPGVVQAMEDCAAKGVKAVAIISSGFAEVGNVEEELKLKQIADENGIAFIGPNILGLLYTPSKLNASFGPTDICPGRIAFISQSGALAIALMGWTVMEKIGLASLVSLGNKADVDEKELIEYFNDDPNVDVVLIYMEGVKDGRKFLSTKVKKPVIVLKVGRSERGAKAAASHTGSLAGADRIFDAAFSQLGMLRANSFDEAFGWARAFSLPAPKGEETVIITNGGGIGVSTTDVCEQMGIKLLDDSEWLEAKFRSTMPSFGSTKNPVDITGGGGVASYRDAVRIAFAEDRIENVIVLYCETAVTNPVEIAEAVRDEYNASNRSKPVVVCMVGGERSRQALNLLNGNNIPAFSSINETVSALKGLHRWKEISSRGKDEAIIGKAPEEAVEIIDRVKAEGRGILMEHEAREVLELCGVPTPKWAFASDIEDAVAKADGMYPLAIKIASPDIVHKTDVGGVVLNIRNEEELRLKFNNMMKHISSVAPDARILGVNMIQMLRGIECIVGLSRDPQFGPVVMFGLGGVFVEALKDVSFRIVPFGRVEAARLIKDVKAKKILDGFRGMKADKETIIQTMCAIQKLAPLVKEIDINPLITNSDGSFAVDARIVL